MTKFEKDFREWYLKNMCSINVKKSTLNEADKFLYDRQEQEAHDWFSNLEMSMKWGVYVDFFDGAGILIEEHSHWVGEAAIFGFEIRTIKLYKSEYDFRTRSEARKAALKKAIEIYNK